MYIISNIEISNNNDLQMFYTQQLYYTLNTHNIKQCIFFTFTVAIILSVQRKQRYGPALQRFLMLQCFARCCISCDCRVFLRFLVKLYNRITVAQCLNSNIKAIK